MFPSNRFGARARLIAALAVMLTASACLTSPRNGDKAAGTSALIKFGGTGLQPSRLVRLEASSSAGGPFVLVPGASATTSATPTASAILPGGSALPLYGFSFATAIPAVRWHSLRGVRGECATAETFVRVRDGSTFYRTFDPGMLPYSCIQTELAHGTPLAQAIDTCTSDQSPVVRIITGGPSVHVGDVVIDDAADVAALQCVSEIQGSLTVTAAAPLAIALPNLESVTGDVSFIYTSYIPDPPPAAVPYQALRCGALKYVTADVRTFDLPLLTEVGGDLTLTQQGSFSGSASTQPIDLHLNALASVGGDVNIEVFQFGASPCGLTALPYVPGDVTITFHSGEVDSSITGLLSSVTAIGGTLTIDGGHNSIGNPIPALTQAGGLTILKTPGLSGFHFPLLTYVSGAVYLEGVGVASNPSGLTHVGSLELVDTTYSSLQQVGGAALAIDSSLAILDNPSLTALMNARTSKVSLSSAASLTIDGNAALPSSEICSFVGYQAGLGWSGPSDLGSATCP